MTSNIFNFTNQNLCEYVTIFSSVSSVLDHLLFTIGNGYNFDENRGMIYSVSGKSKKYIDEYPRKTAKGWAKLIEECHAKEDRFKSMCPKYANSEEILANSKARYKIHNVTAADFAEDSIYNQIQEVKANASGKRRVEYIRPYPLSKDYAYIFYLNKNTPSWFLQIAVNTCNAWVRFLSEELESNNVWSGDGRDYADAEYTTQHRDVLKEESVRLTALIKG